MYYREAKFKLFFLLLFSVLDILTAIIPPLHILSVTYFFIIGNLQIHVKFQHYE